MAALRIGNRGGGNVEGEGGSAEEEGMRRGREQRGGRLVGEAVFRGDSRKISNFVT